MLHSHRALRVSLAPSPPPPPRHGTSCHALFLVSLVHCLCPLGRSHGCRPTTSVPPSACRILLHFTSPYLTTWPGPLGFSLALVLALAMVSVLAPGFQPTLELSRAWAIPSVECGAASVQLRCGAVLCFACWNCLHVHRAAPSVRPSHISASMRSSCGYGCVGIHRRLWNSRPRLCPTQLVARCSLHP